jgi:hypothetical protein
MNDAQEQGWKKIHPFVAALLLFFSWLLAVGFLRFILAELTWRKFALLFLEYKPSAYRAPRRAQYLFL